MSSTVPESLWSNALLVAGTVALIAVGLTLISRIRRDVVADRSCRPQDLLAGFRVALESGEMDEAEFQRISVSLRCPRSAGSSAGRIAPARPTSGPPVGRPGSELGRTADPAAPEVDGPTP